MSIIFGVISLLLLSEIKVSEKNRPRPTSSITAKLDFDLVVICVLQILFGRPTPHIGAFLKDLVHSKFIDQSTTLQLQNM